MADIHIESLFKIFGKNPKKYIDVVKEGISKEDLLEKHGHILGLNDINMHISECSIHVVMGLSGSGKSTLIRHINRLIDPTAGNITVDGIGVLSLNKQQLLEFRRNRTAMVFQKFALLPHKTIIENASFGLQIQNINATDAQMRAQKWLDRVGLSGFEQHYPQQLSGGMQQRVGLARALANDADILLMDEAFSALDPLIRKDMQDMLLTLQDELQKTIVFITHDLDEALRLGDRVCILKDGKLVQDGKPEEIIIHPADDYVREFVQDVNRFKVLRAKTLMTPVSQEDDTSGSTFKVHEDHYLESFLPKMLEQQCDFITVTNTSGDTTGRIKPHELSDLLKINLDSAPPPAR